MMFFAMQDMPPAPMVETMQVAKAPSVTASSSVRKMTYGTCKFVYAYNVDRPEVLSVRALDLVGPMTYFLSPKIQKTLGTRMAAPGGDIDWDWFNNWRDSFTITVLRKPQHGKMVDSKVVETILYLPNKGYLGKDRIDLLVEAKDDRGRPVAMTLRHYINVLSKEKLESISDIHQAFQKACGTRKSFWRISQPTPEDNNTPDSYRATSLCALLTCAKDVFTDFADLSGSALGSTTGNKITLDTNAAGYGWFIDATPYQNEEWLPTSNPNEWVAKPGSEAEGKMDLLSVLLHEYGHVLGIEHTADRHDLMASILQPGVRHLPDVDAWAALLDKSDNGIAFAQGSTPILAAYAPNTPTPTNPGAPIPMTVGLTAAFLANRPMVRIPPG